MAVCAYFIGVIAIIVSGIMLKKLKAFAGEPAPFVMELPAYHVPSVKNVLHATWERGWSFIKRAGTIILASSIILWFLQGFGFVDGAFGMVEDNNSSLLAAIGSFIAPLFRPLGFGDWRVSTALITGFTAKESVVSTLTVLLGGDTAALTTLFTPFTAIVFLVFTLLYTPCVAAIAAVKRELGGARAAAGVVLMQCGIAWIVAFVVHCVGTVFGLV